MKFELSVYPLFRAGWELTKGIFHSDGAYKCTNRQYGAKETMSVKELIKSLMEEYEE